MRAAAFGAQTIGSAWETSKPYRGAFVLRGFRRELDRLRTIRTCRTARRERPMDGPAARRRKDVLTHAQIAIKPLASDSRDVYERDRDPR